MEIDFSAIWSWTLPLWGLAVLILFLGGALTEEPDLTKYVKPDSSQGSQGSQGQTGGFRYKRS